METAPTMAHHPPATESLGRHRGPMAHRRLALEGSGQSRRRCRQLNGRHRPCRLLSLVCHHQRQCCKSGHRAELLTYEFGLAWVAQPAAFGACLTKSGCVLSDSLYLPFSDSTLSKKINLLCRASTWIASGPLPGGVATPPPPGQRRDIIDRPGFIGNPGGAASRRSPSRRWGSLGFALPGAVSPAWA